MPATTDSAIKQPSPKQWSPLLAHRHGHDHDHDQPLSCEDVEKHQACKQSSDFLNIDEPPEASKTPDPSILFPLRRKSSSNYQTALLSNKLKSSLGHSAHATTQAPPPPQQQQPHHEEGKQAQTRSPEVSNEEPSWSSETIKRSLHHASIDLSHVSDHDQGIFNVVYNKIHSKIHHGTPSTEQETDPLKKLERTTSGDSLIFHSNQVDVPIPYSAPITTNQQSQTQHSPEGVTPPPHGFEYDKYKRSMQYDY